MSGTSEPRFSGVFRFRERILERMYRTLEARGMRFSHRQPAPAPVVPVDYEAVVERFYRGLRLEGCVAVDVGAHVGRHTVPLSRCVGTRGTVHAFEPIPHARKTLAERLFSEGCHNVAVHPYALADRADFADFCFLPAIPEESGLRRRDAYSQPDTRVEPLPVRVARLDDTLHPSERVRFIKMDVEGGERDVLRGAARILDQCRPIVAFECGARAYRGYHETSDEIYELFASRGYEVYAITGQLMEGAAHFRMGTELQVFWDYVALAGDDRAYAALLRPPSAP